MSQLMAEEVSCLLEGADLSRLVELQEDPSLATPEETEKAINCLGDESALRAFLTELIGLTGPLSEDTSDCLRAGFGTFDVRSVMLARQMAEDEGASLVGSASAFMLTLSCLNEEEWSIYVPPMIMNPDDREKLQCVVETLGGPEELAAALQPSEGEISEGLLNTAAGVRSANSIPAKRLIRRWCGTQNRPKTNGVGLSPGIFELTGGSLHTNTLPLGHEIVRHPLW